MKINKHFVFRANEATELYAYLKNNNIPFNEGDVISTLDILDSDSHWMQIQELVQRNNLLCLSSTLFTKAELGAAEWLSVRSEWRFGYPQPENTFTSKQFTYSREFFCSECGCGEVQVAPFRIKKAPKWSKRHFAELNWIGDELFVSNTAKEVLEASDITGVSFSEVNDKNGQEVLSDIYQLIIPYILKNGLVEIATGFKEINVCPKCGMKKFVPGGIGMKTYRKEIFEGAPDIVKTAEVFGSMHYSARDIIIRQKAYRTIVDHQLDRGLIFEPIELA